MAGTSTAKSLTWTLAAFAMLLEGCGSNDPRFYQVQGLVTLDGRPLPDATLTFQRIAGEKMEFARPSICIAGKDGRFAPWTLREGDGLPAGKYRVGVMAQKQIGGPPLRPEMTEQEYAQIKWKSILPRKFEDARTSGIEIEVGPDGMQPTEIALSAHEK